METWIWFLIVGLIAGWLAGLLIKGSGFGILGDMIVGVLGAVFGAWLFGVIGLSTTYGFVGALLTALVGSIALLALIHVVKHA